MNTYQYYPVIRWKGAEKMALSELHATDAAKITPIIELIPKNLNRELPRVAEITMKDLATYWRRFAFIDLSLLPPETAAALLPSLRRHRDFYHNEIGIVSRLETPYQKEVKDYALGAELCLRLRFEDLSKPQLLIQLNNFLRFHSKAPEEIHLIIDFEAICSAALPMGQTVEMLPYLANWKTVTILLGAFPQDLTALEKNSQHTIPRLDWLAWSDFASSFRQRKIGFGDYNIAAGKFHDNEGKKLNFSASLRYTSNEYWVIMRGEGVFNDNGPGFAQYPAQAMLLCERSEFSGPNFSCGDRYIHEMAQQSLNSGTAKEWLRATVNHHLTFVPRQLASLRAA